MAVDPDSDPDSGDDGEGTEWRFSLEEIEQRNAEDGEANEGETEAGDDGGNIAGAFGPGEEIEPGDIDFENALFVLVGVVLAVLVLMGFANVLP